MLVGFAVGGSTALLALEDVGLALVGRAVGSAAGCGAVASAGASDTGASAEVVLADGDGAC